MSAHSNGDDEDLYDNIIFDIKDRRLYVAVVTFQQKTIKSYNNFLEKDLKDPYKKKINKKQE